MDKVLKKIIYLIMPVLLIVSFVNYIIDPANIYHNELIENMAEKLLEGNIIRSIGDEDEGVRHELVVSELKRAPETLIVGSSHVIYIPFEYKDYYNVGESGAKLGDIYAMIGLFDYYNLMPQKIVIGIDQWIFKEDAYSLRNISLTNYANYEIDKVLIPSARNEINYIKNNPVVKKISELISFSYFQSSLKNFRNIDDKVDATVIIEENVEISEFVKVMPNGSRILGTNTKNTTEEIIEESEWQVTSNKPVSWLIDTGYLNKVEDNIIQFEALVDTLLERGITVELYLPTWNPIIYDYCVKNKEVSGGLEVEKYIRSMADKRGILVRGSYNPKVTGMTVEAFWDWQHMKPEKMLESFDYIEFD